ncbi:MAG: hypothetical protein JSV91_08050 [Phycisphaerales bacterium]|nr:MAG: hypothetical protein JSV91_08050 [Phycisphaerales bacterium]
MWEDAHLWPFEWVHDQPWANHEEWARFSIFWAQVVVGWLIWAVILAIFTRRGDPRRLHDRLILALLGGTILEVLITLPNDVMVRSRTDCYCATGTSVALCCSVRAFQWLAGLGIVLAITSRRRRFWGDTRWLNCGYAKGPTSGDKCTECGYLWN